MTRGFRRESCVRGVATSTRKVATVEGTVQKDATGREQAWDGHVRPATWAADKHPPRFSQRAEESVPTFNSFSHTGVTGDPM